VSQHNGARASDSTPVRGTVRSWPTPSVADLVRSFELHLRAENKAGRTIETYLDALRLAAQFLAARGVELEQARREDIEAFIADQLARWKPATAANRYRSLRVF
jgi:site-specific recombinase XerD